MASDSPRAALRAVETVSLRATGAQEGALRPLLRITPAGGCSRLSATANKFVHILWKNLICDNVAVVSFCAGPGRRECWRCKVYGYCSREGDAPAGCRAAAPRWGGSQSPACRNSSWVADGKRHLLLRAQRVLKGKRVIDKREKTAGCLPLARSAAAHTRRSGRPASNRPKGGS